MWGRVGAERVGAVSERAPAGAERAGTVAERAPAGAERKGRSREGTGGCDSQSVT